MIKFVSFLVVSVALAAWLTFTPLFPATLFIKWQYNWFDGSWYPKYTFAVVWILVLLAMAFVFISISWIWEKIKGNTKKSKE
jgi:uncharacterized membrane protein